MSQTQYALGAPGLRSPLTSEMRRVLSSCAPMFLPGGKFIDGTKTRDPGNSPNTDALRAGLILGKITSGGYYANSIIGTLTNAELTGSTALEVSAASAVEIVRRIGATGTLKVTGPPAASGVVRTITYTYSAVNTSTGAITVTAVNANMVQRIDFDAASTAGNLKLQVSKVDGSLVTTANIAWNATDATYLASINSALDTATGVSGGIVASAISAVDTDLGFLLTYAGTGYAGQTWPMAQVMTFPTSSTLANYSTTIAAVDGRQIAGAFVQPTDGSETPITFLPDGPPMPVTDMNNTTGVSPLPFPQLPISAIVLTAYLVDYPTDSSLKTWLKNSLSTLSGAKLIFDDVY